MVSNSQATGHAVKEAAMPLTLALQGGGAHGAFTWGVLDTLLAVPTLEFEGLSGSSAGAMNAVAMANGWLKGGREGARQGLADFWSALAQQMPWPSIVQSQAEYLGFSLASQAVAHWAGQFSPSQINPLALNPLRELLLRQIDFKQLRKHCPFKLFIGTTQANTGKLRVFREHELDVDVLLASACLPKIHRAVYIQGQAYWDGGYCANPAVFPLLYECDACDLLLVLLSPLEYDHTPQSAPEIATRITELGFSANFMREMGLLAHSLEFARSAAQPCGRLEQRLQQMRFHMIDSSHVEGLQRTETKLMAHSSFLEFLHVQGQERARQWIDENGSHVGRVGTLDLKKYFT